MKVLECIDKNWGWVITLAISEQIVCMSVKILSNDYTKSACGGSKAITPSSYCISQVIPAFLFSIIISEYTRSAASWFIFTWASTVM